MDLGYLMIIGDALAKRYWERKTLYWKQFLYLNVVVISLLLKPNLYAFTNQHSLFINKNHENSIVSS